MGKYTAVMKERNLQRLPVEPSEYQQKVDQAKQEFLNQSSADLATRYATERRALRALEQQVKERNLIIEALTQLLSDTYEHEGITSLKLEGGVVIATQPEPYAQVTDKQAFRKWCIEQGLEDSMHLWPSTTQALVRERLLTGSPDPEGVSVFIKTKVTARGLND